MNHIKLLLLVTQTLTVLSATKLKQLNFQCGQTPKRLIKGQGNIIQPHTYSWLASLEYESGNTFEHCAGSVISPRYVLTAAHCVEGVTVEKYGNLTGVRLGNFSKQPYCEYGTWNCTPYLHFGITHIKKHEHYRVSRNQVIHNDIALLRLDSDIPFDNILMPICLPPPQVPRKTSTPIVTGWSNTLAKRAIAVPILRDHKLCAYQDRSRMCAGALPAVARTANTTCHGDTGGQLMQETFPKRRMSIVGIASFSHGDNCAREFFPTYYTRVAYYLRWIKENVHMNTERDNPTSKESKETTVELHQPKSKKSKKSAIETVEELQFPSDCGHSPIYPHELSDGGYIIPPDEFSWLASLVYANNKSAFGHCSGSVIHSRYVLTAGSCVTSGHQRQLGNLIGIRLGDFSKEIPCDYGTASCHHYQFFAIDSIKVHENFRQNPKLMNDIALLKLARDIEFGRQMKPICLPFVSNNIDAPFDDSILSVSGWWTTMFPTDIIAKRNTAVGFWNTASCRKAKPDKETQFCGVKPGTGPCTVELGSPLMNMFKARYMVLEGIASSKTDGCPGTDVATLYTRVRSYEKWITNSIKALEAQ